MPAGLIDKLLLRLPPAAAGGLARKAPRSLTDWKASELFRWTVRYAYRNSSFYRERFDSLKIDPRGIRKPSDLGDFFTTPEDIIEMPERFLCRKPHMVFESSGTTGRNKRVYYGYDELDRIGRYNAAGLFLGGVTREDRLANAFDFCIWIPGMVTHKGLESGRFFELASGKVDPEEIYKRMPVYKFTVVFGEPTWLIKLTEIAEKRGSYPLRFIVAGAEHMPLGARSWMEKVWHGAKVRMVYGTVESGGILGFEPFDECKDYHIDENNFLVEIADPAPDGYGEVAYTTLGRTTMPLIRYKNRDISRMIEDKCRCGLPYRKLANIRGRADEIVVASAGNLYPLIFEEALKDVEGISHDWQVVIKTRGMKEILEFNIECAPDVKHDLVKEGILSRVKARCPDMWRNFSINIFEIGFNYHPVGSLRRGRKLLRLVDERSLSSDLRGDIKGA
jgi:phenylacetate-CoA ligase